MKKLIILALLAVPSFVMAQSEWEAPVTSNNKTTKAEKKEKKPKAEKKDTTVAKTTNSQEPKLKIDKKYAAGAVPLVDGKVEWDYDIAMPGKSAEELYDSTLVAITNLVNEPCQSDVSAISAVNKKEHIIAAQLVEELVFSKGALAKDFTEFKYTLIATCTDGNVNLRLCRISYLYDKGRDTQATYTAEEWITDKEALNKKGTNTYRLNGKFRKKTIDRKDTVFQNIEHKLKYNIQ